MARPVCMFSARPRHLPWCPGGFEECTLATPQAHRVFLRPDGVLPQTWGICRKQLRSARLAGRVPRGELALALVVFPAPLWNSSSAQQPRLQPATCPSLPLILLGPALEPNQATSPRLPPSGCALPPLLLSNPIQLTTHFSKPTSLPPLQSLLQLL